MSASKPHLSSEFFLSVLLVFLGILHAWTIVWPFESTNLAGWLPHRGDSLWWLQMLCIAGLYAVLRSGLGDFSRSDSDVLREEQPDSSWNTSARTHQSTLPSMRRIFVSVGARGFCFAWVWLMATVWWLYTSMHVYGGLAAWLTILAIAALCAFLASYWGVLLGLWGVLYARLRRRRHTVFAVRLAGTASFAAFWLLAELARHHIFTGFPWAAAGYAHIDGPLRHLAPHLGVYGVATVAVWSAVAVVECGYVWWERRRHDTIVPAWGLAVVLPAVCTVALTWAAARYNQAQYDYSAHEVVNQTTGAAANKVVRVRLLQGNIPQGEKFDMETGVPEALSWYREQLMSTDAQLTITPETAVPLLPYELPLGYMPALGSRFGGAQGDEQAALIGMPLGDFEQGYTNSLVGIKPSFTLVDGERNLRRPPVYTYKKQHLVPFGEFIPRYFKWFTQLMQIPLGDFVRGAVVQSDFEWAGVHWSPTICYEDVFGDEMAKRLVHAPHRPLVFVNVSNIAWFGDSVAIDQHLVMSRMRALELSRPLLRATNTGATAAINHRGKVTDVLPFFSKGYLDVQATTHTWQTPYAWWAGRYGHWPLLLWACAVIVGVFVWTMSHTQPVSDRLPSQIEH